MGREGGPLVQGSSDGRGRISPRIRRKYIVHAIGHTSGRDAILIRVKISATNQKVQEKDCTIVSCVVFWSAREKNSFMYLLSVILIPSLLLFSVYLVPPVHSVGKVLQRNMLEGSCLWKVGFAIVENESIHVPKSKNSSIFLCFKVKKQCTL